MSDLIELKEAAKILGITPEELNEFRSNREIHGYRDGSTWKFKQSELDRFASSRDLTASVPSAPSAGDSGIDADLEEMTDVSELGDEIEADSILVSEVELGGSDVGTASTIIGRGDKDKVSPTDSDIEVASEPTKSGSSGGGGSSTKDSDVLGGDLELVPDDSSASGIRLAAGSDVLGVGEGSSKVGTGESDTADLEFAADSDVTSGSGPLQLDDDLSLGDADDLELESPSTVDPAAEADDDELVLDVGTGSDVSLAGDSGINLGSPIDSGLSLEQPLELAGSDAESLELGEAEVELDEAADSDVATQLKADDDFLLTPVEGDEGDETDTGSQVIALDTEEFDESAATMLGQGPSPLLGAEDLIEDDISEGELDEGEALPTGGPLVPQSAVLPEAKYSVVSVLSLFLIVIVLGFTGILMADLVRNVWSWNQPTTFSSSLMDWVLNLIPTE